MTSKQEFKDTGRKTRFFHPVNIEPARPLGKAYPVGYRGGRAVFKLPGACASDPLLPKFWLSGNMPKLQLCLVGSEYSGSVKLQLSLPSIPQRLVHGAACCFL